MGGGLWGTGGRGLEINKIKIPKHIYLGFIIIYFRVGFLIFLNLYLLVLLFILSFIVSYGG